MTEPSTAAARTVPPLLVAVFAVAAVVLGGAALLTIVSAIGLAGLAMLTGVVGSFAFVVLTVSRRRPISPG